MGKRSAYISRVVLFSRLSVECLLHFPPIPLRSSSSRCFIFRSRTSSWRNLATSAHLDFVPAGGAAAARTGPATLHSAVPAVHKVRCRGGGLPSAARTAFCSTRFFMFGRGAMFSFPTVFTRLISAGIVVGDRFPVYLLCVSCCRPVSGAVCAYLELLRGHVPILRSAISGILLVCFSPLYILQDGIFQ